MTAAQEMIVLGLQISERPAEAAPAMTITA
jgi:hypothetical protein